MPSNSLLTRRLTTTFPPIILFTVHIQAATKGAPNSINKAISLAFVLGPNSRYWVDWLDYMWI